MELRKSFEFGAVSVYGMFRVYGPREARAAKPGTKEPILSGDSSPGLWLVFGLHMHRARL